MRTACADSFAKRRSFCVQLVADSSAKKKKLLRIDGGK